MSDLQPEVCSPMPPPDHGEYHGEYHGWRYSLRSVISGERVYVVMSPSGSSITSRVKSVRELLETIDHILGGP